MASLIGILGNRIVRRPQVCAARLRPADDGKVRTFTRRPTLRRWRRRSAGVNDENCIASRNAAGISIRTKGAPRVREGQLEQAARTCETYGRDGREDEEVSRCHEEVDVSRACTVHAGRLASQAELSRWKDRLQTAPVCFVSSSSMWRARRSANKRAPG